MIGQNTLKHHSFTLCFGGQPGDTMETKGTVFLYVSPTALIPCRNTTLPCVNDPNRLFSASSWQTAIQGSSRCGQGEYFDATSFSELWRSVVLGPALELPSAGRRDSRWAPRAGRVAPRGQPCPGLGHLWR